MKVAVIGAGINGVMTCRALIKKGYEVHLYDKKSPLSETSSKSTNLLHGGLRYLETYDFELVKEAIIDRDWWLKNYQENTNIIPIYIPVKTIFEMIKYKIGLCIYDYFSKNSHVPVHTFCKKVENDPLCNNYRGYYIYYDGQMDSVKLGMDIIDELKNRSNFILFPNIMINKVGEDGTIKINDSVINYDKIVNVSGPWSDTLLEKSGISPPVNLKLVQGTHIIIDRIIKQGYLLKSNIDKRYFFVLPYKNQILIGTTELCVSGPENLKPSDDEIFYLIESFNFHFDEKITTDDIHHSYCGVRPLIDSKASNSSKISREYMLYESGKIISVFGGKWTTSKSLGNKVCNLIDNS